MAGPSNGRPLLQLIAAASARLQAANFKPPSNTIEGIKLSDWYSPGQPVTPIAPPNQSPKGWQFWAGQNLQYTPRYDSPLSAAQLEALSMFPLVRLLIENVKDQICRLPWKIQLRPQPGEPKSARMKREAGDKNIVQLSRLFEYPDRESDWSSWLRPLLEDMLVPDAATILKERAVNGAISALRVIRGKMITRYVDENGFTPRPPNPAYAQDWWGMPFLNLTTEQLLYKPRNIVTREFASSNLYGCSPTEALAPWINFGIQRLMFQTAFYTAGSIPDAMMVVPKGIGPDKIEEASMVLNSQLSGQLNKRRNMSYVQGFTDDGKDQVLFPKSEALTDETDEYLVNILCYGYGQSPSRLRKMMNRATAESSQTASVQEGTLPMVDWLRKCVINPMIQMDFGLYDYEITFDTENELDIVKRAQADKSDVDSGIIKRNEARESRGLDPDPSPEANELTITTISGVIPLAGSIDAANVSREIAANPPEPKPALPAGPQKIAKRGRITIDPRRRTHDSSLAVAKIHGEVAKIFHGQRDRAQHKAKELMKAGAFDLLKADSPRKVADEIYSSIAVSWDALPSVARHALEQSAISGVFKGIVDLDLTDHSMISAANQTARGYAEHRAAEMVGMKWEDGKLVANPSAKWAISDTTRDELRTIVKNAFEAETPMDALVKSIGDAGAFSDSRAQMIANTEVATAQAKGNYAAWDESGLVVKKSWLLSADHDEEDECSDNADASPIPFDEAFPSGDYAPLNHPNCRCVLLAVEIAEVE